MRNYLVELSILMFASLSFFFLGRSRITALITSAVDSAPRSGLIGLGVLILVPFIGIVLLVSVIGVLLGATVLVLYALLLLIASVLACVLIGNYLESVFMKKQTATLSTVVIGTIAFSLMGLIPYVGGLALFAAVMIVLGSLSHAIYRVFKP